VSRAADKHDIAAVADPMRLSEEQLSLAWLTATRHVDNDMDVWS